ncbi:uncharacterized protein LOC117896048 [Drosophila subobscura]|uniref:uncharacterized protein LOC117896048 n=1 Tax=Drosophila subobscura TaxID=7241 RepID=UPI00155A642C|nr:uncharacterized protein LOC117896048 [Drosophila subobscura]
MKGICGAATVSLVLWISLIRNAHAEDEPPLSVLTAAGEDGQTPLIVLTSSTAKPLTSEAKKDATTETGTTSDAEGEVTIVPETQNEPTRAPPKKKPALNFPQGYLEAQLLSMPEMWNSSPHLAPVSPPFYYPMPVYFPYPIPFMLNQAQSLRKVSPEDRFGAKLNELLAETLLKDSGLNLKKIWKDQNENKITNHSRPNKWRGKWRKKATTTSTEATTEAANPTEPTRLKRKGSPQ